MRALTLAFLTLVLAGCPYKGDPKDDTAGTTIQDLDGDGFSLDADCDDEDPEVHAGAEEVCDGKDNDCDEEVDEESTAVEWFRDADGDGYGTDTDVQSACLAPDGYVAAGGDCDDASSAYHPNAAETDCTDPNDYNCDGSVGAVDNDADGWFACQECNDGDAAVSPGRAEICNDIDDNCDGVTDTDAVDAGTWYYDVDGDGYGDVDAAIVTCDQPEGTVATGGDCNDADAAWHPGADEFCDDPEDLNCDGYSGYLDNDGDGFASCEDCDDGDATVSPDGIEVCNGADDDCDGTADEDATDVVLWYADADGDGYGDATVSASGCEPPAGYVGSADDCDDTDAAYNPGASETCADAEDFNCDGSTGYADGDTDGVAACEDCDDADPTAAPGLDELCDGVDNDCDGSVDEADALGAPTWYADADGDGWGDDGATLVACDQPAGFVAAGGDCDDTSPAAYPGAPESCTDAVDLNCDGSVAYSDVDGDGVVACDDCDDADAAVFPGAVETCNGVDDDCDGTVDGPDASGTSTFWFDADGDGWGDDTRPVVDCTAPDAYVDVAGDCDDGSPLFHPGADEACTDTEDYNCDGSVAYADGDGDGWAACEDCDDADADVNPAATEVCDGVDDDCDGTVDGPYAAGASAWYVDADGDGWGDASGTVIACDPPAGFVGDAGDCDDASTASHPGQDEVCDLRDNDCDGTTDVGASDATAWYTDADGDGWGDDGDEGTLACSAPDGTTDRAGDCDDAADDVNPAGTETCDHRDEDCDGVQDDGAAGASTWYADLDEDGYGDATSDVVACDAPAGYVADDTDCDDLDGDVHPGALEWCNEVDDDCNDVVDDEDTAVDATTWYADADGDGYGDSSGFVVACDPPAGTTDDYLDCDDSRASVNPAGTETCNGLDDDCSGDIDDGATDASTWYADVDEDGYGTSTDTAEACSAPDGYVSGAGDCDDADGAVRPGASERCNEVDDDCDGSTDESAVDAESWYTDADGDGYGTGSAVYACAPPSGAAAVGGDCDDTEADANPGEVEVCDDFLDNDCDGDDNGCEIAGANTLAAGADWTLTGAGASDYLGSAVALGDVSGDGVADVIVGSYGWDSASNGSRVDGRVYVHRGDVSASDTLATADTTLTSTQTSSAFGWSVAALGDVSGDGLGDLVVGAYRYDVTGGSTVTDAGAAFIYTGQPSGAVNDTAANTVVRGVNASDQAGWVVAAAGDTDDDGFSDVLVAANLADGTYTDGGGVGLFLGPLASGSLNVSAADTWFVGTATSEQLGSAVADGADLDGDGVADVALGAHLSDRGGTDAGAVYVFYGPVSAGTVSGEAADVVLVGATAGDQFGRSIAMGDTDDDGAADLLVGADYVTTGAASRGGAAYVFDGTLADGTASLASASFTGVTSLDYAGRVVASAGDVNGDGPGDLLVSATGYDNGSSSGVGTAYLLYGPFSGTQALSAYDARLRGSGSSDAAGYALAGGGDVNDDGFAEFAVTSIGVDATVSNVGASWLFYGGGI